MTQNATGNQGGNTNGPKNVTVSGKISVEYDPKAVNNVANAIREQTTAQDNAGNASDGISNRGVQQQRRANNISIWALGLSSIGLVATLVIIWLNFRGINAAESALAETRIEFEAINRPFLQIGNVKFIFPDTIRAENRLVAHFDIVNMGKTPAKLLHYDWDDLIRGGTDAAAIAVIDTIIRTRHGLENGTIGNESEGRYPVDGSGDSLSYQFAKWLKTGYCHYYIFGELEYQSVAGTKRYKYSYIYKILNDGHLEILRNDDVPIK